MDAYLVGGAVRDGWLGHPVKDRDFVVIGQTPQAMLGRGFRAVGQEFPVFLHPQTGEEYALARTERRVGPGHRGFAVVADPSVTLEEDLSRRDLTINAIAQDLATGRLIDPHGGVADLERGVLRHVSPAFEDDPLRVLRVARFAARYAPRGFSIDPDTLALMARMVADGKLAELTPERVWGEVRGALMCERPSVFLQTLRSCGALAVIAPELDALYGVPQVAAHHPEIDTGVHTEMVLDQAARLAPGNAQVGFAALVHDLGKALTPAEQWPTHHDHESGGLPPVRAVCARWKVPSDYAALAEGVCALHLVAHRALEARPGTLMGVFDALDGWRRRDRIEPFVLACEADARGRLGLEDRDYRQAQFLRDAHAAASLVSARPFVEAGLQGEAVGQALRAARLKAITQVRDAMRREPGREKKPKGP